MNVQTITTDQSSWPPRPLEAGGDGKSPPAKKVPVVRLDSTDRRIIELCCAETNWAVLRQRIAIVRRLSLSQIDGCVARLTAKGANTQTNQRRNDPSRPSNFPKDAETAATLAAMVKDAPFTLPANQNNPLLLNRSETRAMDAIWKVVRTSPDGTFITNDLLEEFSKQQILAAPSAVLALLQKRGLVAKTGHEVRLSHSTKPLIQWKVVNIPYRNKIVEPAVPRNRHATERPSTSPEKKYPGLIGDALLLAVIEDRMSETNAQLQEIERDIAIFEAKSKVLKQELAALQGSKDALTAPKS